MSARSFFEDNTLLKRVLNDFRFASNFTLSLTKFCLITLDWISPETSFCLETLSLR